MMDVEKSDMSGGTNDGGQSSQQQKNVALQSVNNLVYTLQPDLSVAVNRTHKKHFFQAQKYGPGQRGVCILNSGADYIDTTRSWMSFSVDIDQQPGTFAHFGRNGSACNLIDSITISTRSGDELTRLTDFGLYNNMLIPMKYSEEWLKNQGALMGYGSYVSGRHYKDYEEYLEASGREGGAGPGQYDLSGNTIAWTKDQFESMHRDAPAAFNQAPFPLAYRADAEALPWGAKSDVTKFVIPMYVLSEFFNYGRLIPAMVMSGLRIEIEWAAPSKAFFGVKEGMTTAFSTSQNGTEDDIRPNTPHTGSVSGDYVIQQGGTPMNEADSTSSARKWLSNGHKPWGQLTAPAQQIDTGYTSVVPITSYVVTDPEFTLCSVQLSDSIQRALNEQSATNGLEIVYNDLERTEASFNGAAIGTHTEVRKSCSRALNAIARVRCTRAGTTESRKDSFRSEQGFPFLEYQWQLGSLYFPQQPVKGDNIEDTLPIAYAHTLEAMNKFNPGAMGCALPFRNSSQGNLTGFQYEASVYDGFVRNAAPGTHVGNTAHGFYQRSHEGAIVDPWLFTGHPGTYANDQHCLAVSLERSNLFSLAGVPVNNSRVLALRTSMVPTSKESSQNPVFAHSITNSDVEVTNPVSRRVLTIFLKYVKLARVFLNNVEVEQ